MRFAFIRAEERRMIAHTFQHNFNRRQDFSIRRTIIVRGATRRTNSFDTNFRTLHRFQTARIRMTMFRAHFFNISIIEIGQRGVYTISSDRQKHRRFSFTNHRVTIGVFFIAHACNTHSLGTRLVARFENRLWHIHAVQVRGCLRSAFTITRVSRSRTAGVAAAISPAARDRLLPRIKRARLSAVFYARRVSLGLTTNKYPLLHE